jgi:SAM-dependent methyltransferase
MSAVATVTPSPLASRSNIDASRINGDLPMTGAQRRAYIAYHAARNAQNSLASREARITITRFPGPMVPVSTMASPSRLAMHAFFDWALREASRAMPHKDISALDLGCGNGVVTIDHLIDAGFQGHYIGVDIARHPKWSDAPRGPFSRALVIGQAEDVDLRRAMGHANSIDLLISSTALEHIERRTRRDPAIRVLPFTRRLADPLHPRHQSPRPLRHARLATVQPPLPQRSLPPRRHLLLRRPRQRLVAQALHLLRSQPAHTKPQRSIQPALHARTILRLAPRQRPRRIRTPRPPRRHDVWRGGAASRQRAVDPQRFKGPPTPSSPACSSGFPL